MRPTQAPQEPPVSSSAAGQSLSPASGSDDPHQHLNQFLTQLLEVQCQLVGGIAGIVYLARGADGKAVPASVFRAGAMARETDGQDVLTAGSAARLERLAARIFEQESPVDGLVEIIAIPRGSRSMYGQEIQLRALAAPLVAEGRVEGACLVVTPLASPRQDTDSLNLIRLAAVQFEAFLWRQQCMNEAEQKLMLRETVELLDAAQQGGSAETMGAILCHELQRRFGATRVSVGLVKREFVRLVAVSGTDTIDRNAPAVDVIEAAMEECALQDTEIVFPAPPGIENDPAQRRVTRAHAELSRKFGPSSMLTLPLRVDGDLVGVALLEREAGAPFPLGATSLVRLVAETLGPALWTRRLADRGIVAVARDQARDFATELVGPRHTGAKLLGLAIGAALLAAAVIPIPGRVSAPAEVRAAAARTIAPPFSGFLAAVHVRPGDHVTKDQLLAEMDVSELKLQLEQAQSEERSLLTQHAEALAKGDMARAKQYEFDAAKSAALAGLYRDNLSRAQIRSPIDGLVGRGELEQFVRAKIDPNQPLLELVTSSTVCVAYVDERDIQRVKASQPGKFVSKAMPGDKALVHVARITPVAEPKDGRNAYEVELEVDQPSDSAAASLRPGMTGTVRLDDGWTTTMATLLRPVIDEIRLRWWW